MQEKFNKWCEVKKKINFWEKQKFYVKQREIWYANIWMNIWYETFWKWNDFIRPILVIKRVWTMFLVVPMTTKWVENYFKYKLSDTYFWKKSFLLMTQWKFIDYKRFLRKIKVVDKQEFNKIKKRLITNWF